MTQRRLDPMVPALLDDARARLYERIVGGPRGNGPFRLTEEDGSLTGPFGVMLLAPAVGGALSSLGEAIRYHTTLSDRTRELAILAVAAHRRASYEWYAHERVARGAAIGQAELDQLREGASHSWQDPLDGAVHRAVLQLLDERRLDDRSFRELSEGLGVEALTELVALVGYYDTLALLMGAFDIGVPGGEPDPFA